MKQNNVNDIAITKKVYEAKQRFYPPSSVITVTKLGAEVQLQPLLDLM